MCSGAFHSSKPEDMLSELLGRLPVRVELKALTKVGGGRRGREGREGREGG